MNDETNAEQTSPAGEKWGDPISLDRQAKLQSHFARDKRHTDRERLTLTGADVYWLAKQSGYDGAGRVPNLHLEQADMHGAHLEGAHLRMAHLEGVDLHEAHLEHADLGAAYLKGANLSSAYMERISLRESHLEGANLKEADSRRADFRMAHLDNAHLAKACLEAAFFNEAYLQKADLTNALLNGAELFATHLEDATLDGASLEGANLRSAYMRGADFRRVNLRKAFLREAHLEGAIFGVSHTALTDAHPKNATIAFGVDLSEDALGREQLGGLPLGEAQTSPDDAHLEGVDLAGAYLDRAVLIRAHLEGASLREAHLESANLINSHLEGTDLRGVWLDSKTVFGNATLDTDTKLGDIQWGGVGVVNLTQLPWESVSRLGDEQGVSRYASADDHQMVVRAYRQVAAQLRVQGLSEVADRFSHRALSYERRVFLRRGNLPRYLGSWFLAILAGYGYRPLYTIFWYLVVVLGFAFGYYEATHGLLAFGLPPSQVQPLQWYEALVLSVSAFHGRGFFQPIQSLGDPVAILAAIEAIVGLIIEISFIATFTQRFFGSK